MEFNTRLLHDCAKGDEKSGATLTPIYQNSAFYQPSAEQHDLLFHNRAAGYTYTRINNPTIAAFEERINRLEGGLATIACASGMAALTNAILNIVGSGDEIIASSGLYGGSIDLFHDFEAFGITTHFVDADDYDGIKAHLNEHTKILVVETIGNPKLDVADVARLAEIAHGAGIPLLVDNTVATPYLCNPLSLGADIVVHSTSKYVNGHSDAISGTLTLGKGFAWDDEKYPGLKEYAKFGPLAYIAKLRNGLFRNTGACLAPQTAYYNMLGLETLGLRMERICANAEKLAGFFDAQEGVSVNYPGLSQSVWHETAVRTLHRGFGGVLTIRLGSRERAFAFINALQIPWIVSNIGDTKTLVVHPASTINAHSNAQELAEAGVTDDLVRISVGIEDIEDLIADFENALSSLEG